jgi:hypothetical protein
MNHLCFLRRMQIDTVGFMDVGSIAHDESKTKDAKAKYSSHAAMMYREQLARDVDLDAQKYGEVVVLDEEYSIEAEPQGKKSDDFFHEGNYISSPTLSSVSDSSDTKSTPHTAATHKTSAGSKAVSSLSKSGSKKMTLGDMDALEKKAKEEVGEQHLKQQPKSMSE